MKLPVTRTPVQTRYSDTDALGHFSNSSYVVFLEVGRLDFFDQLMKLSPFHFAVVVANINVDILRESHYGQAIEVTTRCVRVGTKSLTLANEIFADGQLVSKATVTMVAFDTEARTSVALPQGWEIADSTD